MHFALPPRKTSNPPPYARASAKTSSDKRRRQLQYASYAVLGLLTLYLILNVFSSDYLPSPNDPIPNDSSVLIVTVMDEDAMSEEYISIIKENRNDYATRHGYQTLYTNISSYAHLTQPSPSSWALVPALRHALTMYPEVDYIWSLTPHAIITNPALSLHDHVLANLTNLMCKDVPVVPPDSVIHTFSHLRPSQVYLILTQDMENVAHTSFILRNTQSVPVASGQPKDGWSHYFLDAWFDPLYRAYAFQKAENHALEHMIQWHPTILAKLAIIDQRLINSYNYNDSQSEDELKTNVPPREHDSQWQAGDLLVNFKGCSEMKDRNCEKEIKQYYKKWQNIAAILDGKTGLTKDKTG